MSRLRYRPSAKVDLDRIVREGEDRWGADAADDYLRRIDETLRALANFPARGSDQSHIFPGLRKYTTLAHHAYYFVDGNRVDVVRILHPAMDVAAAILPEGLA